MNYFPENLEFAYASKFRSSLLDYYSGLKTPVLSLENVERASLSCVQILIALKIKADKEGVQLSIECSESLLEILQDLGLEDILH
jgi:anti-anti-sigma regulatory factor